jgi:hypothetical protein
LAIAHAEGQLRILDAVYEFKAPLNPEWVVQQMVPTIRTYGCGYITSDAYAGRWVMDAFGRHGIQVVHSSRNKSDIYLEALPLLRAGRLQLLDNARLASQLVGLERRVSRGGKESIDHPPGGHDDVVNAALGALTVVEDRVGRTSGLRQIGMDGEPWHGWFGPCEYRKGEAWNGRCPPARDAKGRAIAPGPRVVDGVLQPITQAEMEEFKKNPPPILRPGRGMPRITFWG